MQRSHHSFGGMMQGFAAVAMLAAIVGCSGAHDSNHPSPTPSPTNTAPENENTATPTSDATNPPATTAAPNTVVQNGKAMPVRAAVAVWDASIRALHIELLPVAPESADIDAIAHGQTFFAYVEKPSPDPTKWKNWTPFATMVFGWTADGEVGQIAKAGASLSVYGIEKINHTVTLPSIDKAQAATITGAIKPGTDVRITAKGKATVTTDGEPNIVEWNIDLPVKILALKTE